VNGWNNVSKTNGGVTGVFTSAYTKTKYTWDLNYIVGPENVNTTSGLRNLVDTTLLLTPNAKFNAYINYDYGQNRDGEYSVTSLATTVTRGQEAQHFRHFYLHTTYGDKNLNHWQGVAFAARQQVTARRRWPAALSTSTTPTASQPEPSSTCTSSPRPTSTSGRKACW